MDVIVFVSATNIGIGKRFPISASIIVCISNINWSDPEDSLLI